MKKKILVGLTVLLVIVFFIIVYFVVVKEDKELEIKNDYTKAALNYMKYNNLEEVSVGFLIEVGVLSEDYENSKCFVVNLDSLVYESCEVNRKLTSEPLLVLSVYENDKVIEYTNILSDKYTLKLELVNETANNFLGVYTESDEFISENCEIEIKDMHSGNYKYIYDGEYIIFRLTIDNDSPVIGDFSINGTTVNVNYVDDHSYNVYYYYSLGKKETTSLFYEEFSEANFSEFDCDNDTYYVYTYAVDAANNYSVISYIGELNYSCQNNFTYESN